MDQKHVTPGFIVRYFSTFVTVVTAHLSTGDKWIEITQLTEVQPYASKTVIEFTLLSDGRYCTNR